MGTQRNSGPGPKSEKRNFTELGALLGKKSVRPKSFSRKLCNFLYILRFHRPEPQGWEIAKYWGFRPFWPGAAPWHLEKLRAENRKTQFPRARGTFGEKVLPPQKFPAKNAQLFDTVRSGRTDPHGREIANYGGFRPSWPGAALGT